MEDRSQRNQDHAEDAVCPQGTAKVSPKLSDCSHPEEGRYGKEHHEEISPKPQKGNEGECDDKLRARIEGVKEGVSFPKLEGRQSVQSRPSS